MRFASIAHFGKEHIKQLPKNWQVNNLIISPQYNINGTKGFGVGIKISPKEIMKLPREEVRNKILEAALYAQNELGVELIQLGALTTSVTKGGIWLTEQKEYSGYVNHGDSYTAAIACHSVKKAIKSRGLESSKLNLAIIGAYGIIGEALSKILVPDFNHTLLIGRRMDGFKKLKNKINGNFEITTNINTNDSDVIITATNHINALLKDEHLKKKAIVIDVSQPPNLSNDVCLLRPDILRVDGGYVNFPKKYNISLPGMPKGKLFSCIVEAIMQAKENEKKNHVGSINIKHLKKTEIWGQKYGFILTDLTNFGEKIKYGK